MSSGLTFPASEVRALAGLTPSQLRDWTSRRGIVPADRPAAGRGQHAAYAWGTVLALRIVAELHTEFGVEIAFWAKTGVRLRDALAAVAPLALYGKCLWVGRGTFGITSGVSGGPAGTVIMVPLDPHLEALAIGLGFAPSAVQLNLFPVLSA